VAAAERVRRTTLFSGQVQGVGFRFTARDVARQFDITGYVRNLPDGRVELVIEGAPAELERFVAEVEQAMAGCIRDRRTTESPATGEFSGFGIRH
jgi:acylphosphatase